MSKNRSYAVCRHRSFCLFSLAACLFLLVMDFTRSVFEWQVYTGITRKLKRVEEVEQ
jgi:hypothetical protein